MKCGSDRKLLCNKDGHIPSRPYCYAQITELKIVALSLFYENDAIIFGEKF